MRYVATRVRLILAGVVRATEAFEDGDKDYGYALLASIEDDARELVAELESRQAA